MRNYIKTWPGHSIKITCVPHSLIRVIFALCGYPRIQSVLRRTAKTAACLSERTYNLVGNAVLRQKEHGDIGIYLILLDLRIYLCILECSFFSAIRFSRVFLPLKTEQTNISPNDFSFVSLTGLTDKS